MHNYARKVLDPITAIHIAIFPNLKNKKINNIILDIKNCFIKQYFYQNINSNYLFKAKLQIVTYNCFLFRIFIHIHAQ